MKKYRFLALVMTCFLILGTFSSCGKKEEYVYYLNFKPEVATVYNEIADAYEKETGISLRVVTAASGTYERQK